MFLSFIIDQRLRQKSGLYRLRKKTETPQIIYFEKDTKKPLDWITRQTALTKIRGRGGFVAGVLASQGKPSHMQLASLMSAVSKLGCSTPDAAHYRCSWESSEGWPWCLGHCTHVEDLKQTLGSWLWYGPVGIWGVSLVDGRSLSACLPVSVTAFHTNENSSEKRKGKKKREEIVQGEVNKFNFDCFGSFFWNVIDRNVQ